MIRRLLFFSLLAIHANAQSFPSPGPGVHGTAGGGGPTIAPTSAVCTANNGFSNANCTLAASGAVGDLMIFRSKSSIVTGTATLAITFSGTASCATPTQVIAPTQQTNGAGKFVIAEYACLITTAGANNPVATWSGTAISGTFTDINVFTVHTSNTWKTTFIDQTATPVVASVTSTSCPTGTTAATTTANDFILATCDVFNAGQTQGAMAGFTAITGASTNTSLAYYKVVTSTGTQTATVPLSATDFGVGMIAAFASN